MKTRRITHRLALTIALLGAVAAVALWPSHEPRKPAGSVGVSVLPPPIVAASSDRTVPPPEPPLPYYAALPTTPAAREHQLRDRARTWSRSDLPAAAAWLLTLSGADAAIVADAMLAEVGRDDTPGALSLAYALRRGLDDGRVEHLAQIWTEEDPTAAVAWITALPPNADRDRLLARTALVRVPRDSAEAARLLDAMMDGAARDAALMATIARLRIYDPLKAESWQAIVLTPRSG